MRCWNILRSLRYLLLTIVCLVGMADKLGRGLAVPRDVSLVVLDDHPAFEWFEPQVSYIRHDTQRWVPRVLQWVDHVANGKEDRRETLIRAKFIEGGTIGPPPR